MQHHHHKFLQNLKNNHFSQHEQIRSTYKPWQSNARFQLKYKQNFTTHYYMKLQCTHLSNKSKFLEWYSKNKQLRCSCMYHVSRRHHTPMYCRRPYIPLILLLLSYQWNPSNIASFCLFHPFHHTKQIEKHKYQKLKQLHRCSHSHRNLNFHQTDWSKRWIPRHTKRTNIEPNSSNLCI